MRRPASIRRAVALVALSVALMVVATTSATAVELAPGTLATRAFFPSFGDINGDGLMDLGAYADSPPSEPSNVVVYALQSAPGVFGQEVAVLERPEVAFGGNPRVILADLTGDARLEELVALVGQGDQIAYMQPMETAARPAGDRRWSVAPTDLGPAERSVDFFATGDVTGDGRVDALLLVRGDGPKILVAHNHGSASPPPSFEDWLPLPGDPPDSALDLLDVNRDGVLDIVVATGSGVGYLSARGGGLTSWTAFPVWASPTCRSSRSILQRRCRAGCRAGARPGRRTEVLAARRQPYGLSGAGGPGPPGTALRHDAGELNGDGKADLVLLGCGPDDEVRSIAASFLARGRQGSGRAAGCAVGPFLQRADRGGDRRSRR